MAKNNISKRLKELSKNAKELDGKKQDFKTETLFHDGFMKKNTKHETFENFLSHSPVTIETQDDFDALKESEKFNSYVASETNFESWEDMVQNAGFEQISKQIFD